MNENNKKLVVSIKILTILSSVTLLLLSLNKEAYYIKGMENSIGSFGLTAFLLGWMNLFGAGICWLANPFLFMSWIFQISGSIKKSFILGVLAMFFSLLFLGFNNVLINEAGQHGEITKYGAGYWLWLASCGMNFIGTLLNYITLKKNY